MRNPDKWGQTPTQNTMQSTKSWKRSALYFYLEEEEIIMTEEILNAINGEVYGVWFLIGAALVFWMQAGLQWWRQVLPEQKMQVTS